MNSTVRGFSTAARVHPSILPHLHASPRRAPIRRWVKTAIIISAVGYASKSYLDLTRYSPANDKLRAAIEEQDINESLRRQRMMEDLYGGRESLEDLEKGVAEYARR
ncbi:hypothetical protein BBK36DRAFT_1202288 [Trichoderma citrinoviride]|uniref:Uncharacterized protein n=1 Tax=Trichoderma citrinoviride TaxID=58853 RepID=A0A2T4B8I2_9HYPO|nr:hypothetical protein BBK36DRAFT_1202288 [Trichoderma citrinoviride]PTB65636.1 hypothetical protein BBK36DRAFT_1202288 [Trichoderma citrinoviride]